MKFVYVLITALALTACGQENPQNLQYPPAPVAQQPQQAPQTGQQPIIIQQESSTLMPALLGAAAGYMMGSAGNSSNSNSRIVEREVIREVPSRGFVQDSQVGQAKTPAVSKPVIGSTVPQPTKPATPNYAVPNTPKPSVAPTPTYKPAPTPSYTTPSYTQKSGSYSQSSSYSSVRQSAPTYRSSPSSSSRSSRR